MTDDAQSVITLVGSLVGGVAGVGALVVAFVKWLGGRVVETEDEANKKRDERLSKLESAFVAMGDRMTRNESSATALARDLGRQEQESSRLAGRIDGLQADWRTRFEKLQDELRARDERIIERIIEVKGDNAKGVEELRGVFETYRVTMHERFTEITRLIVKSNEEQIEAQRILREHASKRG